MGADESVVEGGAGYTAVLLGEGPIALDRFEQRYPGRLAEFEQAAKGGLPD